MIHTLHAKTNCLQCLTLIFWSLQCMVDIHFVNLNPPFISFLLDNTNMKFKFGKIILMHITILFNHVHALPTDEFKSRTSTMLVPTSTWNHLTTMLVPVSTWSHLTTQSITTSYGVNQTKHLSTPSLRLSIVTTKLLPKSSPVSQIISTLSTSQPSSVIPKSSSMSHPKSPTAALPLHSTNSPSPNHKSPKTTLSGQAVVHKVGLIVGIVLGLVTFSICLIVFHKKETRLKCLKLMCRPCTKNYSSRYNIVPIYVYDDTEEDIRELQDDSDLPLV